MSIFQCPTCGGHGWMPQGCRDVGWYETQGYIRRTMTPVGELLIPTGRPLPEPLAFERCWCNGTLIQLSHQMERPLYWKDESGETKPLGLAVWRLLNQQALAPGELDLLRQYLAQWVMGIEREGHKQFRDYEEMPRTEWLEPLARAQTGEDVMAVVHKLVEYGLDPL